VGPVQTLLVEFETASQRLKNDKSPEWEVQANFRFIRELFQKARDCLVVMFRKTSSW